MKKKHLKILKSHNIRGNYDVLFINIFRLKSKAFSDFLTVEKDELILTLCNIWQFSFKRVEVLLILDSGKKNYIPVTILNTPKCP